MGQVVLDRDTHDRVTLLAAAWDVNESQAVARLVGMFAKSRNGDAPEESSGIAVHALYAGTRVDGTYDPKAKAVTITSGPLAGQRFKTPTGAARAVVGELRPEVSPHRNGWGFWIVTDTGNPLQSIR